MMCILLNDIIILIYIMFDLFIKFTFLRNKWRNISIELSQSLTFAAQIRLIVFIMVVHQIHYNRHHHSRNEDEAINIYRLCIIYMCTLCIYGRDLLHNFRSKSDRWIGHAFIVYVFAKCICQKVKLANLLEIGTHVLVL